MIHRPSEYREDPAITWNHYHMPAPPVNPAPAQYDYTRSYRDEENGWAAAAPAYYEPAVSVLAFVSS